MIVTSASGITSSGTVTFSGLGTGLVKSTSGVLSNAAAGSDYQSPLTFSNGLVNNANTVTLGGSLSANTTLADSGFNFNIAGGAGNVGIGTTTPSAKLHVVGDIRVTGAYYDSSNSAGSNTYVLTSTGTGTAWNSIPAIVGSTAFIQGGNSFGALAELGTNDNNSLGIRTSGVERVRINTNGNVGIGTTNPSAALAVGNNAFTVNSSGAITGATGITSSGTVSFTQLSTNGVVYTSGGNGTLNTESQLGWVS